MNATYRTYQLPWEMAQDQDDRFKKILKQTLIALLAFSLVMPWLPIPEADPNEVQEVPPRFARLLIDKPAPPPPPPVVKPKKEEPVKKTEKVAKTEEVKPVEKPKPVEQKKVREKAAQAGLLPFAESLAELRDNPSLDSVMNNNSLSASAEKQAQVERSIISSNAGKGSGGINTSNMSRNTGGTGLESRGTTKIASSSIADMEAGAPRVAKGGGAPSRSREEIELVFEKNKGAIFALYNRALRRDPGLQGKLVLELTIEPNGAVTDCKIVSSELNDPEMERKLVQRVKMFRFQQKDVATVTTTKPIDFFPA